MSKSSRLGESGGKAGLVQAALNFRMNFLNILQILLIAVLVQENSFHLVSDYKEHNEACFTATLPQGPVISTRPMVVRVSCQDLLCRFLEEGRAHRSNAKRKVLLSSCPFPGYYKFLTQFHHSRKHSSRRKQQDNQIQTASRWETRKLSKAQNIGAR